MKNPFKKVAAARDMLHDNGFYGMEAFRVFWDLFYCRKKFHCTYEEYFQYKFYNLRDRVRKNYLLRYHQRARYDFVNTGSYALYGVDREYTLFQDEFECEQIRVKQDNRVELEHFIKKHGTVIFKPCCDTRDAETFVFTAGEIRKYLDKKLAGIAGKDYRCQQIYGKERQYTVFWDKIGREWMYVTSQNRAELEHFIRKHGKVIFKPSCGSRGAGIFAFTADKIEDHLSEKLAEIAERKYLCEQYVIQHPKLAEMNPGCVNTIRVVTLCDGQSVKMLFGSLRTGAGEGVCDNMSIGGVGTVIDMETGISITPGIDFKNRQHFYHPVTGTQMIGFEIPFWTEVKEMLTECAMRIRADAILGWDIAITENGPCIIELNRHPESGNAAQIATGQPRGEEIIDYINKNWRRYYKIMPKEIKRKIKKSADIIA